MDQFNEQEPRSSDSGYLARCASAQYEALRAGDPKAVWVLQGWLFVFQRGFLVTTIEYAAHFYVNGPNDQVL